MRRIRYRIRNVFGFSKTETNGVLVLLPLMVMLIFSQSLYQKFIYTPITKTEEDKENKQLDSIRALWDFNERRKIERSNTVNAFPFNPNTLSKAGLESLGLPSYLAQRVVNYRSKGGRFDVPTALLKIYGIDSSWYDQIESFIQIPVTRKKNIRIKERKKTYPVAKKKPFDLNTADSTQLKSIFGIGSVLSSRIVRYRDKLGGFINKNQVYEVYGLDSSTAQALTKKSFITPDFSPKKINVNTPKSLFKHPYIKPKLAKIIAAYRFQHGDFITLEDLQKIDVMDSGLLNKMKPYLEIKIPNAQ